MKIKGNWETKEIWLDGKLLSPLKSQEIVNHSPDGFNWGYSGSGCSQLALAILLEVYDKEIAIKNYQEFKFDVIANLPSYDFEINLIFKQIK